MWLSRAHKFIGNAFRLSVGGHKACIKFGCESYCGCNPLEALMFLDRKFFASPLEKFEKTNLFRHSEGEVIGLKSENKLPDLTKLSSAISLVAASPDMKPEHKKLAIIALKNSLNKELESYLESIEE